MLENKTRAREGRRGGETRKWRWRVKEGAREKGKREVIPRGGRGRKKRKKAERSRKE